MRAAIATKENNEDDESKEGNTGPAFFNIRVASGFKNVEGGGDIAQRLQAFYQQVRR